MKHNFYGKNYKIILTKMIEKDKKYIRQRWYLYLNYIHIKTIKKTKITV